MTARERIFGTDQKQAFRILRLLISTFSYFIVGLMVLYCFEIGFFPQMSFQHLLSALIFFNIPNLVFYGMIRSGFNLRFADPSLTAPQMIVATVAIMYAIAYTDEARGAFLLVYAIIPVAGIFKLRPEKLLLVGFLAVAMYGTIIWMQIGTPYAARNLSVEVLQWWVLVLIIPWLALVGAYTSNARCKLRESNSKLSQALLDVESAMQTIQDQASHDDLTGIHNRRHMMQAIAIEQNRAERTGGLFCILILDIDHFKRINDSFGHLAGDRVLVHFAQMIREQLRPMDCFARFGGEEFLLLMPQTTIDSAQVGAERIRQIIEDAMISDGEHEIKLTVSIGVAEYRSGESIEEILSRADRALYDAKSNGRNCVEIGAPYRRQVAA